MKTITVMTDAECRTKETWTLNVPDDFPAKYGAEPEYFLDLLDHPEEFGARIVSVTDETYGETDREITGWEIGVNREPERCPVCDTVFVLDDTTGTLYCPVDPDHTW